MTKLSDTQLAERVLAVLEKNLWKDRWDVLIALYRADREAFYRLAFEGLESDEPRIRQLSDLARRVREAVWESYEIEASLVSYSGDKTEIPFRLVHEVAEFLRNI